MVPYRWGLLAALLLAGCEGGGLGHLDTESEAQRENSNWFHHYYGEEKEFYGTAAKEESGWWGSFYGTADGGDAASDHCSFWNNCP